jgi:hypothetical protein
MRRREVIALLTSATARSITSALVRRMQPDDTAVPIDQGSFEP